MTEAWVLALKRAGFQGTVSHHLGRRITHATDNSIYQVVPQWVVRPTSVKDVQCLLSCVAQASEPMSVVPQGGSTSTVGQSLGQHIVVDLCGMQQLGPIDRSGQWIDVEPGVTLQALNNHLASHGFAFPVQISPADRATLGGMVATNAAGPGSFAQGRMGRHLLAAEMVLADGTVLHTDDIGHPMVQACQQLMSVTPDALQAECVAQQDTLPRGIGGYDLVTGFQTQPLPAWLCGSEGTLGVMTKLRLRIRPIQAKTLLVLHVQDGIQALGWRQSLLDAGAASIEMMDNTMCALVRAHPITEAAMWLTHACHEDEGLFFITFEGPSPDHWEAACQALAQRVGVMQSAILRSETDIAAFTMLRKHAVGLISRKVTPQGGRPLAMLEDTAVPPAHFVAYITALRALLHQHGLPFGMYGHVDACCLHVRPALDLTSSKLDVPALIEAVMTLCHGFGGIFWGEHGLGRRTVFAEEAWGPAITDMMRRIKTAFDPRGLLNPGCITSPSPQAFLQDWRAHFDATGGDIASWPIPDVQACNGNAACLGDQAAVMCPSYRVSQDKTLSPKGRAQMLRFWQVYQNNPDTVPEGCDLQALEDDIYASLSKCLGCGACVPQCPVAVNIPNAKSVFLHHYHQKNRRSFRSHILCISEWWAGLLVRSPSLRALHDSVVAIGVLRFFGLVHLPSPQRPHRWSSPYCVPAEDAEMLLWPDVWSMAYQPEVWQACEKLLTRLGIRFHVLPPLPTGIAAHAEGNMHIATKQRQHTLAYLDKMPKFLPILVVEPSMLAFLHAHWQDASIDVGRFKAFEVWLMQRLQRDDKHYPTIVQTCTLLQHCSAQAQIPAADGWARLLQCFGISVLQPSVGCCGMAGAFGYQSQHRKMATVCYQSTWQAIVADSTNPCATGFSCRQMAKQHHHHVSHPLVWLVQQWVDA